jgi:hypothetical protein
MSTTAETLFRDYFLPLYPEDARSDLGLARATDANPANNPSILARLDEIGETFAAIAPAALGVREEDLRLDFTDASIHRLGAALGTAERDRLASQGTPGTPDNALFNVDVHGAAYVGATIVRAHGGSWAVRRPLWESFVYLKSRAGEGELPVFHWLLKSLADGATATLADRYRAHVEVPTARPEELPIIAPADRNLPKLTKVRYDVLYKYIKAHIPELKDVGEHFPSPERFEELGFESLQPILVGGGRMLVLAGHSKTGLHVMWLTKAGFEKSAFYPCDAFPAPIVRAKDGKLEILLSHDQKQQSFELLWWGP